MMAKPVGTSLTPAQEGLAVSLLAQGGKTLPQIAAQVGCSIRSLTRLKRREDTATLIASISLKLRNLSAEASLKLSPKLYEFCEAMLATGDAKQVDAAWRAWAASEKIRQGISLEHLAAKATPDTKVGITIMVAPYAVSKDFKPSGQVVIDHVEHLNPVAELLAHEESDGGH
jgi:hypothetical protein